MNARFQENFRGLEMNVIGCDNRDGVNSVRPLRFRRRHFRKTPVSALWRDVQLQSRGAASLRIRRERPRDQLKTVVHTRRNSSSVKTLLRASSPGLVRRPPRPSGETKSPRSACHDSKRFVAASTRSALTGPR